MVSLNNKKPWDWAVRRFQLMLDFNTKFYICQRSFVRIFGIIAGIVGILSGCSSVPQVETLIHESPKGQVILKTFTESVPQTSHPATLDSALIKECLRGFRVQEEKELLATLVTGEGPTRSIFSEPEIQFLTPFILEALAKATPEEYVWFKVAQRHQSKSLVTSGTLFFVDKLLHVGLQEFQSDTRRERLSSKASVSPTRIRHWTLDFYPIAAKADVKPIPEPFSGHSPIGALAIDVTKLQDLSQSQKFPVQETTVSQPHSDNLERKTQKIQNLEEEIGELQQQLRGQQDKLRQIEKRLEDGPSQ